MRMMSNRELQQVSGGVYPPIGGRPPSGVPSDVTEGLSSSDAEALIGYIEALGAFTDPLTAFDADAGLTAFNAVEQSILIPHMQDYCEEDLGEQWRAGPAGSLGYCSQN